MDWTPLCLQISSTVVFPNHRHIKLIKKKQKKNMSTLLNRKYWVTPCFEPHGFGLRTFVVEHSDSVKISASSVVPLVLPGTAVPSSSAHSSSSYQVVASHGKRKIESRGTLSKSYSTAVKTNSPSAFNGHFHFDRSCFKSHQLLNFQQILSSMDRRSVDLHIQYIW